MSRSGSRYDEEFYRSSGKGSGHSSPRGGSRRDSRDIYGDFSPEISRRNERPQRRSSIGTRNFFTDALDDLERNLRKVEDESSLVMHDFNAMRNQHQSQTRRINDLMRNFEEARYRIDRINHRSYRVGYGSDHLSDTSSDRRSSIHSLERGDRPGSFRDQRSKSKRRDETSEPSDY